MRVGANYLGNDQCEFTVWAPNRAAIAVELGNDSPQPIPLQPLTGGYWQAIVDRVSPGTHYRYRLDEATSLPDPASYHQPLGVHGPSAVVDPSFEWTDTTWQGHPLETMILYEVHVGTFTPAGTFAAMIERLPDLKAVGINTIELMPIAQFPGDDNSDPAVAYRNWGYDGVYPFAVQNSYGTPQDLKRLVNACHAHGIAIILDVVYNHLGPEGNYSSQFAPYFTDTYHTPWGNAMNFDAAHSLGVRHLVLQNALYWLREFHFDGLRLDAIQAIYDFGAKHILQELAEVVELVAHETGYKRYLIAESDLNDPKVIRPPSQGGYGLDAQWSDDFHHALHTLLTGDRLGYYSDFGRCADLAKAYEDCFVYDWRFSPFRQRMHGAACRDRSPVQFAVCAQNHDQIGNQMKGERFAQRLSFEGLKLAAGAVLLSPFIPLLFMGEEYGDPAPFIYFVSHSDPELIQAVRAGRKEEFEPFHYADDPPDPEAVETFLRCKLNWELRQTGTHHILLQWYRRLIELRHSHPVLLNRDRASLKANSDEENRIVRVYRWNDTREWTLTMNFGVEPVTLWLPCDRVADKEIDSADTLWGGPGSKSPETLDVNETFTVQPMSLVVYSFDRSLPA